MIFDEIHLDISSEFLWKAFNLLLVFLGRWRMNLLSINFVRVVS